MNAIEIEGLKKSYNSELAVNKISLEVPETSIFGLLGPNGAGKSTIIKIIAGLEKRSAGRIKIFGEEIKERDYKYKQNIGFVLEQPHYLQKLTIKEYLQFVGALYEMNQDLIENRAEELIDFFDLKEKESSLIGNYSKGMKKKVSIAASIIHSPNLLILDEPFEGLDPISVNQTKDNLSLMVDNGVTIVMASHNLNTVEKFCDRVAIINDGRLVFQSGTKNLKEEIKNNVTQKTYSSLEEIFIDVVSDGEERESQKLSWI